MSTTQPLDQRILAELDRAADTLAGLTRRLGADSATVLRMLQQLGSLKRVACRREDGQLLWDVTEQIEPLVAPALAPTAPAVLPVRRPAQPTAITPAPAATTTRAKPRRAKPTGGPRAGNVTERMRAALRAKPWQGAGDLLAALPDVKRDVVYAILSQRVKAGEFVAYPASGRFRRYAHAGTPPPAEVTELKPKRSPRPQLWLKGVENTFEQCLRFIAWAQALDGELTAEQIQQKFAVSRATSYRWLGAWNAAREALAA